MYGWELHHSPYRHYKRQKDDGKWTWEGKDRQRITSVTDVLDSRESLTGWATARTLIAAERAAVDYLGAGPMLARSIIDFSTMTQLTGLMPDTIRDDKAELGTAIHGYLAAALKRTPMPEPAPPFGLQEAVEAFLDDTGFTPAHDAHGPRVERAVGSVDLAVAGTYDAQGAPAWGSRMQRGVHRIDAKSSRTVQPKHLAQVAAYEYFARLNGEEPSQYLTIVHLDPLGMWNPYTIEAEGEQYQRALTYFMANLAIHRGTPKLAKLLQKPED